MTARVVFVAGTATGVGKTWVAARLVEHLRDGGVAITAFKPVESHAPGATTDADLLARAARLPTEVVCPPHRRYPLEMAPPIAAEVLGRDHFTVADLLAETVLPPEGVAIVEGVGGVRSPLASDGDNADLAVALHADVVVLVAPAELGAINAVRLAMTPLRGFRAIVFLNHYDDGDDVHRRNADWLTTRDGFELATDARDLAQRMLAPSLKEV